MAHIIFAGEGYSDGLRLFEKHFHGKVYAGGKSKVRVREIKLYHFGFNDKGTAYKDILSDLKSFIRIQEDEGQHDTTTQLHSKFYKYVKMVRKLFKGIKPIEADLKKVKIGKFKEEMGKKGIVFNMALIPIGKIKDYVDENGVELV